MRLSPLIGTCVVALLLGCSASDSTVEPELQTRTNESTDQLFLAGLSCRENGTITSKISKNTNTYTSIESATEAALQDDSVAQTNPSPTIDCSAEVNTALPGPGIGNIGTGSINYAKQELLVSAATVDVENSNNDSRTTLFLHDGNTRSYTMSSIVDTGFGTAISTRVDWGIYDASFAITAELVQKNEPNFSGGSFEFVPSNETTPATTNYAAFVKLIQNGNADDTIEGLKDKLAVVSGNINISGRSPDWSITLDLTLNDGSAVTGFYTGSFHRLPNN